MALARRCTLQPAGRGTSPTGERSSPQLIDAGGDPNVAVEGSWHTETPLHWAASSDDVEVARALIDGGADLEVTGASIAGGTPLDNAIGYGCWHVARLLVERGARVEGLGDAAALGMFSRVDELRAASPPSQQELTDAFWAACHGGQRRMAEYLLSLGAELERYPFLGRWRQHAVGRRRRPGHRTRGARDLAARVGRREVIQVRSLNPQPASACRPHPAATG